MVLTRACPDSNLRTKLLEVSKQAFLASYLIVFVATLITVFPHQNLKDSIHTPAYSTPRSLLSQGTHNLFADSGLIVCDIGGMFVATVSARKISLYIQWDRREIANWKALTLALWKCKNTRHAP